jgi:LPXTG-site transpeptidase (sortase) family protein
MLTRIFGNQNPETNTSLEQWVLFLLVSAGVISLTYGFFALIDFLPEKPGANRDSIEVNNSNADAPIIPLDRNGEDALIQTDPLPAKIIFDTLKKEIKISNPEADDVQTLDAALLNGAVRHPHSADFHNEGTIVLLGHSSYLPKVFNKNFQAFNDIQKLAWGDTIRLRSQDTEYTYSVDRVYEAKASVAEIPIEFGTPKLVLSTCNSFGTKDDRFIVEAKLVGSKKL